MSAVPATAFADEYRRFVAQLPGKVRSRYHPEYASWHRQASWNGRHFSRYPELIVHAATVDDIVATVKFAAQRQHRVSVRAGGHSYAGCFLQDNGILLDISALREIEVDPQRAVARIGPGVTGRQLTNALLPHGLAFPTGHGGDVGLSGFLLGGGLGINSTAWGPMSVFNIIGVDVVMADGSVRHASADAHPDLFWAARGGGPGLFFVVTGFYLRCHALPRAISNHIYGLPARALPQLIDAIDGHDWDPRLQIMLGMGRPQGENDPHALVLNVLAFGDSAADADAMQAALAKRLPPSLFTVLAALPQVSFEDIYRQSEAMLVSKNYRTDNVFTDRPQDAADILASHLPAMPAVAGMTLMIWRGRQALPDAAYSVSGRCFISTYLQWNEDADDERNRQWLARVYDRLAPLSTGSYVNEFDLEGRQARIARCYSAQSWERLQRLRRQYDAHAVFHALDGPGRYDTAVQHAFSSCFARPCFRISDFIPAHQDHTL